MAQSSARRCLPLCLVGLLLAGCTTVPLHDPAAPVATTVAIAERGWHTDVCLREKDADAWVAKLARGFAGATYLCLGFGEREYVVARDHSLLTMISALLPSPGAILLTAIRGTPAAAFGADNVVTVGVSRDGLAGLQTFFRHAIETDGTGRPRRLADGPYPGSVYFGATPSYDGFYTCNTWTADALRSAELPVRGGILFSGELMRAGRRIAAAQRGDTS